MTRSIQRSAVLLTGLILAAALAGCIQNQPSNQVDWLSTTASVTRGNMSKVVRLSGQVSTLDARELRFASVSGRITDVLVAPGQFVAEGDPLVQLDTALLERQLREARADLSVAEVVLTAARKPVSATTSATAQAQLQAAEYAVVKARFDLDLAQARGLEPLEQAVADASTQLATAQRNLEQVTLTAQQSSIRTLEYQKAFFERAIRDLQPGDDAGEPTKALAAADENLTQAREARAKALADARDAVAEAQAALVKARQALSDATDDGSLVYATEDLAYQKAAVARDDARENLDRISEGPDETVIEAAQASFDATQARVEGIEAQIEDATLRAPIRGAIYDLPVRPGMWAYPSTLIAYLVDASELHVVAQASELDVVNLEPGQMVRTSLDAIPGQFVDARVLSVAGRGDASQGQVSYAVEVALEQVDERVMPGMMATLRVLVGERENVLTIPAAALQYDRSGRPFVSVQSGAGEWIEQEIKLGMSDGIVAEVLSGLEEGQIVLIPVALQSQEGAIPEMMQ